MNPGARRELALNARAWPFEEARKLLARVLKGPLDLPPSAAINQPPGAAAAAAEAPEVGPDGRPVAPPGKKKRLPIDALLD